MSRIDDIKMRTGIPLVLHGASGVNQETVSRATKYGAELPGAKGVPDEAYREAVALGINKINIDTDLRLTWVASIREILHNNPKVFDPRKILGPARDEVKKVIMQKMDIIGSSGKA